MRYSAYDFLLAFYSSYYCVVSGIFNDEKCRDLEIRVKGDSKSLIVISFDRLCIISY